MCIQCRARDRLAGGQKVRAWRGFPRGRPGGGGGGGEGGRAGKKGVGGKPEVRKQVRKGEQGEVQF